MLRTFTFAALAIVVIAAPATAAEIKGRYVEARTCDVWTGPCFANADYNLSGKHAVMAWKIESGSDGDVKLDGLSIVAVVAANNTLGLEQTGPAKAVLIVDSRATPAQKEALIRLAKRQSSNLLDNVSVIHDSTVRFEICTCPGESCAIIEAGGAKIKTRCLDSDHDKACGNEVAFYPPLASGVRAIPAAAVENVFEGRGLGETWGDFDRRGAYIGTFSVR